MSEEKSRDASRSIAKRENILQMAINTLKKPPENRTTNDILILQRSTMDIAFFKNYIDNNQSNIHLSCCKSMKHISLKKDETVFEIDSIGSTFYVILSGWVKVMVRTIKTEEKEKEKENKLSIISPQTPSLKKLVTQKIIAGRFQSLIERKESKPIVPKEIIAEEAPKIDEEQILTQVKILTSGMSFGELALINNKPRVATIICGDDCEFAVLEKKDFKKILNKEEEKKLFDEMNYFTKMPMFQKWNIYALKMVYINTTFKNYHINDYVFQENDESEEMYIVENGMFRITKIVHHKKRDSLIKTKELFNKNDENLKKYYEIGILTPHETFGEENLIYEKKREFNVQCISSEGKLRIIDKKLFFQKIARDEITLNFLKEKNRIKMEYYKKKLKELVFFNEEIKNNKIENPFNNKLKENQRKRKGNYILLKKPIINNSLIFKINDENEIKDYLKKTHSFIFKNLMKWEEEKKLSKSITQVKIMNFMNGITKSKKYGPKSSTNKKNDIINCDDDKIRINEDAKRLRKINKKLNDRVNPYPLSKIININKQRKNILSPNFDSKEEISTFTTKNLSTLNSRFKTSSSFIKTLNT